MVKYSQSKL